jgi:hypothetical protein
VVPAEPEVQLAEQIAYVIPGAEVDGTTTEAQLVIRFMNEADSNALLPGPVQLTLQDGTTLEMDAASDWESFNRNEDPDTAGSAGGTSSTEETDEEPSTGSVNDNQQVEESVQGTDSTTPDDSAADSAEGTESSGDASGSADTNEDLGEGTGTTSSEPSGTAGESGRFSSTKLTPAEADRLYPYGQQVSLPDEVNPENIVSVQSGTMVIQLMPEPKL